MRVAPSAQNCENRFIIGSGQVHVFLQKSLAAIGRMSIIYGHNIPSKLQSVSLRLGPAAGDIEINLNARQQYVSFAILDPFHAHARARLFSRLLLRSGDFLLQNCAIPRNAAQTGLVRFTYEKHATQCSANVRKTR
jgi:hypothetical protein